MKRIDLVCDECGAVETFDHLGDATNWTWFRDSSPEISSALCPACSRAVRDSGETHEDYLRRTEQ